MMQGENFKAVFRDGYTVSSEDIDAAKMDIIYVSNKEMHIIYNQISYLATIIRSDLKTKSYCIEIDGNQYEIQLKNKLDNLIDEMGMNVASNATITALHAPMPGLILDIAIQEGDQINKEDKLFVLEAMKMENIIKSPMDTTIKTIHISKGQKVEKNQLLVTFG